MTQSTLEPDTIVYEGPPPRRPLRSALRILAMSIVVTIVVAGMYVAFAGMPGADATDTAQSRNGSAAAAAAQDKAPAAKGDAKAKGKSKGKAAARSKPVAAKPPAPPSFTQVYRAAAAALPNPAKLSEREKAAALSAYLGDSGVRTTPTSNPGEAARQGCQLLGLGTTPQELIQGISDGGAFSKKESKAFLLGATSLYCPEQARHFD